jgi:hypothetical protein
MYIVAPADPIYHLARTEISALCGVMVFGKADQQRRKDDRRLVAEKPSSQFTALCSTCKRISTGAPEPKSAPLELLSPSRFIVIVP